MKTWRIWIAFGLAWGLFGCAPAPTTTPSANLAPDERIGYIVDVEDQPTHSHTAAYFLARDSHFKYGYDWKLSAFTSAKLTEKIRKAGTFDLVDLKKHGYAADDLLGLVKKDESGAWKLNAAAESVAQRLQKDLGIRTVIVLTSAGDRGMSFVYPGIAIRRTSVKTGLYTRRQASLEYFAIADVVAEIYVLDVPANLGASKRMQEANESMVKALEDFKQPRHIQNISSEEWQPVRAAVEGMIDSYVGAVAEELAENRRASKP